jgi:hypothetical protein
MGESTDALRTLKNETLEHQSNRQERNFIDRERLNRKMHSRVWKQGCPTPTPQHWSWGIYIYI